MICSGFQSDHNLMSLFGTTSCSLSGSQADHLSSGSSKTPSPDQIKYPRLCEDSRPLATDPLAGRQSCLYGLGLGLDPTQNSGLPQVRTPIKMFSHNMPTPSTSGLGFDHQILYSPLFHGIPIRTDRPSPFLPPGVIGQPLPFDAKIAAPRYGLLYPGMDFGNSALRKAATRETTGPLKAWLGEHKKNPYPTKAEKIMLAFITKMTLTQVSTWFANARRRLKKEHKTFSSSGVGGQENDDNEDENMVDDNQDDDLDVEDETQTPAAAYGSDAVRRKSDPAAVACDDDNSREINVDSSDAESGDESNFDPARSKLLNGGTPNLDSPGASHSTSPNHAAPRLFDFPHALKTHSWSPLYAHPISSSTHLPLTSSNVSPLASSSHTISPLSYHDGEMHRPKSNPREWQGHVVNNYREATSEATKNGSSVTKAMTSTTNNNNIRVKKSKIWSISEIIKDQPPKTSPETDEHCLSGREGFLRHCRSSSPQMRHTCSPSQTLCSFSQRAQESFSNNYSSKLHSSLALTPVTKEEPSLASSPQFSATSKYYRVDCEDMTSNHASNHASSLSLLSSSIKAEAFLRLHGYNNSVSATDFLDRRRLEMNYTNTISDQESETLSALHLSPFSWLHSNGVHSSRNQNTHNHAHTHQERVSDISLLFNSDQTSSDDLEKSKGVQILRTPNIATSLVTSKERSNLVTSNAVPTLVPANLTNSLMTSSRTDNSLMTSNLDIFKQNSDDTAEKSSDADS